jgi:hypothetical protein
MVAWGDRLAVAVVLCVVIDPGPVAAQGLGGVSEPGSAPPSQTVPVPVKGSVLVTPVQGTETLRVQHGERVAGAVRGALRARGYPETGSQEWLGHAIVACQTPKCVEQALDAARAAFAIVPAIWSRESGGEELTLTLVQKSGRNLNANGVLDDDLPGVVAALVDELLERRGAPVVAAASEGAAPSEAASAVAPSHPHAWKAGPIILIAGGAAAVVAVAVAAGIRTDTQELNTAAAGAWLAIGAAAIGGGIAWWVVGEKRRRTKTQPSGALPLTMAVHPTGIDLRLRF